MQPKSIFVHKCKDALGKIPNAKVLLHQSNVQKIMNAIILMFTWALPLMGMVQ